MRYFPFLSSEVIKMLYNCLTLKIYDAMQTSYSSKNIPILYFYVLKLNGTTYLLKWYYLKLRLPFLWYYIHERVASLMFLHSTFVPCQQALILQYLKLGLLTLFTWCMANNSFLASRSAWADIPCSPAWFLKYSPACKDNIDWRRQRLTITI